VNGFIENKMKPTNPNAHTYVNGMVMQSRTIPFCNSLYLNSLVHVCLVTSPQCGVESVECGVWSVECEVRSVECKVWSGSVECVKCRMRSIKCRVWSMECKV